MDTPQQVSPALQLHCSSAQIQGARPRQEDVVMLRHERSGCIAFVADGLGGHTRGDEAACLAVSTATAALRQHVTARAGLIRLLMERLTKAFKDNCSRSNALQTKYLINPR